MEVRRKQIYMEPIQGHLVINENDHFMSDAVLYMKGLPTHYFLQHTNGNFKLLFAWSLHSFDLTAMWQLMIAMWQLPRETFGAVLNKITAGRGVGERDMSI